MTRAVKCTGFVLMALGSVSELWGQDWDVFEESTIVGNISGSVRRGHIFRTTTGNVYEVTDYVYLYEYEYSPGVLVLRNGSVYRLIIEGFDDPLFARRLNEQPPSDRSSPSPAESKTPPALKMRGM